MTTASPEMVHVVVAAGMLQPYVGNGNAYSWLADMRRSDPVYHKLNRRLSSFPRHRRIREHKHYFKDDILRVISELTR